MAVECGQVLGSIKLDPQLAGLQRDIAGEIPQPAFFHVGSSRVDPHGYCQGVTQGRRAGSRDEARRLAAGNF
jgi:hypothetical protein